MISKKLFIGLAAGSLIVLAVPVILKYKKEQKLFSGEDLSDEGEEFRKLDEVNDYLLATRRKVHEMVKDAGLRSSTMLQDAAAILSRAKEKTLGIYHENEDAAEEEISKVQDEINKSIEEFNLRPGNE